MGVRFSRSPLIIKVVGIMTISGSFIGFDFNPIGCPVKIFSGDYPEFYLKSSELFNVATKKIM